MTSKMNSLVEHEVIHSLVNIPINFEVLYPCGILQYHHECKPALYKSVEKSNSVNKHTNESHK